MAQLQILVIPVTPFEQNCSVVFDGESKRGAVIDPGGDVARIREAIAKAGVTIEKIVLTHGHLDHAGGAAELSEALGVKIEGPHLEDKFLLDGLVESGARFGITDIRNVVPDRWLKEGDTVDIAGFVFSVIEAPGHTPGSVVLFNAENKFALMGDVLFKGSVGRTDLPRSSHASLIRAIREKILPLGDDVAFLPGHGPAGNIGEERRSNPFLQA